MSEKCFMPDCGKAVVARGLCDTHRKRLERNGTLEQTRPTDWGTHEKHPLYQSWGWIRKQRQVDPSWGGFGKFLKDVGERPTEDFRLVRVDSSKPYGPDNFKWEEKKIVVRKSEDEKDYQREYMRKQRAQFPEIEQEKSLQRRYGITLEQFRQMKQEQNGLCKICGKPETDIVRGKLVELSVDHCHTSGKVRGLLCGACNKGLGYLKDDTFLLEQAVRYLLGAV